MKKTQKYQEKVGLTPGKLDDETEKKGEKLEKDNKKDVNKLDKSSKNIDKRHKEEEKLQKQEEKARIKEMKKFKDHEAESVVTQKKMKITIRRNAL